MEALQVQLNNACTDFHSLDQELVKLRALSQRLSMCKQANENAMTTGSDLFADLVIDPEDVYLNQTAIPTIVTNTAMEVLGRCDGSDSDQPFPTQSFVMQTFFLLKEKTDARNKSKEKYEKIQGKYARTKDHAEKQQSKKRRWAEIGIEKEAKARCQEVKEKHLARRNQINRVRKNCKKIKKVRPEEALSEASLCVCAPHHHSLTKCGFEK